MKTQKTKKSLKLTSILLTVCMLLTTVSVSFVFTSSAKTPDGDSLSFADDSTHEKDASSVTILQTTDVHGSLLSEYKDVGTLKTIGCDYLKAIKGACANDANGNGTTDSGEEALLVNSGDFMQGTPFASLKKGLNSIKLMNEAGYDYVTIGNHEPEFGTDVLLNRLNGKRVDISGYSDDADEETPALEATALAANVKFEADNPYGGEAGECLLKGTCKDGANNNGATAVVEKKIKVNGSEKTVKIGIFGLSTVETKVKTASANIEGLEFENEVKAAERSVETLRKEGVDVIVCLSHVGMEDATVQKSEDVAKAVDGIDVMLDGHSHLEFCSECTRTSDGSKFILAQVPNGAGSINEINLKFDKNGKFDIDATASNSGEVYAKEVNTRYNLTAPDAGVTAVADKLNAPVQEWGNSVLSAVDGTLFGPSYNGKSTVGKGYESNGAEFFAEMYAKAAKNEIETNSDYSNAEYKNWPVVAIENGGGMRKVLNKVLTNGKTYQADPFPNDVAVLKISPAELKDIMECSFAQVNLTKDGKHTTLSDAFAHVYGFKVWWNIDKEARAYGDEGKSTNPDNKSFDNRADTGSRVTRIQLDGHSEDLDLNSTEKSILIACQTYLATGGNNYEGLKLVNKDEDSHAFEISNEFETLKAQIQRELIASNGSFLTTRVNNNRVTLIDQDDILGTYDAKFTASYNGKILANTELTVEIEGGKIVKSGNSYITEQTKTQTVKTDGNGNFSIYGVSAGVNGYKVSYNTGTDVITSQLMTSNFLDPSDSDYDVMNITFDFNDSVVSKDSVENVLSSLPTTATTAEEIAQVRFARNLYNALLSTDKPQVNSSLLKTLENLERSMYNPQLSSTSFTYNGNAQTPSVTMNGLTEGKDFTVTYANNVNAGTATATVKSMGDQNFGDMVLSFTITPKALNANKISLNKTSVVYNGKARKIGVKAKNLTKGTDYTVRYLKNKNAGKATVKVIGKGNYTGTVVKKFKITKANNTLSLKPASAKYKKGLKIKAKNAKGKLTFKSSSKNIKVTSKGSVSVAYGTPYGNYKIKVTAKGNKNYKAKTVTFDLKIA